MNVNQRIKNLREEFNIDQKTLSEKLGINVSVMNRIEFGTRPIRDEELSNIADFFGVSVDYLLCRTENRNYCNSSSDNLLLDKIQSLSNDNKKHLECFVDFLLFKENSSNK